MLQIMCQLSTVTYPLSPALPCLLWGQYNHSRRQPFKWPTAMDIAFHRLNRPWGQFCENVDLFIMTVAQTCMSKLKQLSISFGTITIIHIARPLGVDASARASTSARRCCTTRLAGKALLALMCTFLL